MSAPETPVSTPEARKYVAFSHTFEDPWGEGDEESEVKCTFRFAKPNKVQIKRLQDTAAKNAANASRNLLLDTVHPDDKTALAQAMEDYPGPRHHAFRGDSEGCGHQQRAGKVALSPFDEGDALIQFLLHERPADELEEWILQLARAKWLEERLFKKLARAVHGSKAVK